ncbi:unnamed protein product [Caenorhabditis bovis]|uniref:IBR domain-containing protein n=1 Tax=Caenorhabditis bovis TaxID=2654633 RepID=A0A8S1E6M4_9PELO|nr:unnamed protein product [Caenorhabditis bovis]
MSVQSKNVGFELDDSDFPELNAKMTGRKEKGRRGAGAKLTRHEKHQAVLVKTIDDPDQVLGKRRKERVSSECNDGYALNVAYSLNKNNRWNEVTAGSLLENGTEFPTCVVERVMTAKDTDANVVAFHTRDETGDCRVQTISGRGTNLNAIHTGEGKKSRGRRAAKEAEAAAALRDSSRSSSDAAETATTGPRVQYNIYKPHKNHRVLAGKLFSRNYNTKKAGKVRAHLKKVEMDDIEGSELEQSIHVDEAIYKPSRDFKFCLGDYLADAEKISKPTAAVYVRRQSIESMQQASDTMDDCDDLSPKPFYLLDISAILRTPVAFEWVLLDTSKWDNYNFVDQIERLGTNEKLDVQWLDADKKRVSIDASRLATDQTIAAPILVIVIEKSVEKKKNVIRVLLNSHVAPTGPFSWQILKSLLKHANQIEDVIHVLAKLVGEWKEGRAPECLDRRGKAKSRFEIHRENFHSAFNSILMARPAKVLTVERMASLVREEGRNMKTQDDSFEHVDYDNAEFCDDESERSSPKVKCISCDTSVSNELFELDDCWQCRQCLRQIIIEQIRAKAVPLEIPFVVSEGQSVYDILPAIIPLPLLHFYTMMTATEMLQHSDADIGDLGECPSCKQLVHIDRPNEYNTCNCVSCGIHWCVECGSEPHWPMSCASFAGWIEKWEREFELHYPERTESLKRIVCACGFEIECRLDANRAECKGCRRVFNPKTLQMLAATYWQINEQTGELERLYDPRDFLEARETQIVPAPKTIKKEFSNVCGQARYLRISKKSEFEKAIRKLKNSHAGVEKLREIRKTILLIVENGLGFVYNEKKKELQTVKANLVQLLKQWLEIENEIENPRSDFNNRIESIECNLAKTFELIKSQI